MLQGLLKNLLTVHSCAKSIRVGELGWAKVVIRVGEFGWASLRHEHIKTESLELFFETPSVMPFLSSYDGDGKENSGNEGPQRDKQFTMNRLHVSFFIWIYLTWRLRMFVTKSG